MASKVIKKIIDYPEDQPPVVGLHDYVREHSGDPREGVADYFKSLFPIFGWIARYNIGWALGDLIAGLTVGLVIVPQSMSYAKLAGLTPEYGLYSSFVGVFVYAFFATSKDVSIGPVAVMSLEVGNIVSHVLESHPDKGWTPAQIAITLAFVCGFIVLGIGLARFGWLVEFIPAPAVSGFMTGSAISITAGQIPGIFGIQSRLNTRAETYRVIINTLKNLKYARLDAAFGIVGLFSLYAIRWSCEWASRRYPRRARLFFFISILRNGFVIIILTLSAWLYLRDKKISDDAKGGKYPPPSILLLVPRGFKHVGQPHIDGELISAMAGKLPVATIILLLEHIAIAKSFGRLNGYKINPNQELVAIGVTNTLGTLFGAYPATGSFSRTALKSKSGVRTPAAGWITGLVVIVALYGLTDAFFWIPSAGLSAVIIHAVGDLIAAPKHVYAFWRISPLEFFIWLAAVLVTIFSSIENGIYTSIGASGVLLILRIARPRVEFLGRVRVNGAEGPRTVYLPLDNDRGAGSVVNPKIKPESVTPGVLVFRFEESVIYPNVSMVLQELVDHAKEHTRRGKDQSTIPLHDRPWNDPGPRRGHDSNIDAAKPLLRAIVFDFSSVSQLDTTAVQNLVDVRKDLERFADGRVDFHFANITSPWVRRALIAGSFGIGSLDDHERHVSHEVAPVVPQALSAFGGPGSGNKADGLGGIERDDLEARRSDKYSDDKHGDDGSTVDGIPLQDAATPFFHIDLATAVRTAELSAAVPRSDS